MKNFKLKNPAGVLLLAFVLVSCSQGPTAPSASSAQKSVLSAPDGLVQGSAAGDVTVGPNPFDINLVRVAQDNGVPAFYASAGGEYTVRPGRDVEVYIQIWTRNPPIENPRMIVDWGNGLRDNTGCGSCRLTMRYNDEGRYTVRVTLDDRISSTSTRTFTLNVRNVDLSGTFTFSNTALIAINDAAPATPYPSTINVSGVAGQVASLTVTLYGYSHTYHSDVAVVLVGPAGQALCIQCNVGGSSDANNATITFQDGAAPFPSALLGPGSYTFAPSGNITTPYAPAPAGPQGTSFSIFKGTNPNGTWKLFVGDYAGADIGQYAGGWSLTVTTVGASSVGVVRAGSSGVSTNWNNDYIMNYPFQKPDPLE